MFIAADKYAVVTSKGKGLLLKKASGRMVSFEQYGGSGCLSPFGRCLTAGEATEVTPLWFTSQSSCHLEWFSVLLHHGFWTTGRYLEEL